MQRSSSREELSFFKMDEKWQDTANKTFQLATQKVNARTLRPFGVVMGVSEDQPFDYRFRSGMAVLGPRLRHNFNYFLANYVLAMVGSIAISIVTSPLSLLGIAVVGGGWHILLAATSNPDQPYIQLTDSLRLTRKQGCYAMGTVTTIFGFYLLKSIFTWMFWLSFFLTLVHAVLRDHTTPFEEDQGFIDIEEEGSFIQSADSSVSNRKVKM